MNSRAIQGLDRVVKPFLDYICQTTGWKASVIMGGPEPAQGGQLNVVRSVLHLPMMALFHVSAVSIQAGPKMARSATGVVLWDRNTSRSSKTLETS